jgi:hypothetical protein
VLASAQVAGALGAHLVPAGIQLPAVAAAQIVVERAVVVPVVTGKVAEAGECAARVRKLDEDECEQKCDGEITKT